jgi:hypothetical protein
VDADIELLRIKGELGEIKVGGLEVGCETLEVQCPAIGPHDDVTILDPAVTLLVKDGELGPLDLVLVGYMFGSCTDTYPG